MKYKYVYAIDPGTTESGVCIISTNDYKPLYISKIANEDVIQWFDNKTKELGCFYETEVAVVCEQMQGRYDQGFGSELILACEWIGRFQNEFAEHLNTSWDFVFRREEYNALNLRSNHEKNDSGVRHALVDRFAYGQSNYGKGTKKSHGWFYGFAADMWSSYAVAVTYLDKLKGLVRG